MIWTAETVRNDEIILKRADEFGLLHAIERLGGLDGVVREGARNLSAGQARRLMLVRAALAKPKLLLLDEPDDVLDPKGVDLLVKLLDATKSTALIATHNIRTARMADELWLVRDGAIADIDKPDTISSANGPIADFFRIRSAA